MMMSSIPLPQSIVETSLHTLEPASMVRQVGAWWALISCPYICSYVQHMCYYSYCACSHVTGSPAPLRAGECPLLLGRGGAGVAAAPLRPPQGRLPPPHLGAGEAAQGHGDQEPQRLCVRETLAILSQLPARQQEGDTSHVLSAPCSAAGGRH